MTPDDETINQIMNIARLAVEAHLNDETFSPPILAPPWDKPRPVFVTLRDMDGRLRGCIGHLSASRSSLAHEVAADAVLAATKDKRFKPVLADEVANLSFSISILGPAEPVEDLRALDPQLYGVIVTHNEKRGVLLPDIPGIRTVAEQIRVARRKANIADHDEIRVSRFEVIHVPPHKLP